MNEPFLKIIVDADASAADREFFARNPRRKHLLHPASRRESLQYNFLYGKPPRPFNAVVHQNGKGIRVRQWFTPYFPNPLIQSEFASKKIFETIAARTSGRDAA